MSPNAISWFEIPATDLDRALSRVKSAGGKLVSPKMDMGSFGQFRYYY